MSDYLIPLVSLTGFAFLLLWVATHWLKTGNLSAKPSLDPTSNDRSTRPIRFWITVVPILNAGIGIAIVAVLIALMGIQELFGAAQ